MSKAFTEISAGLTEAVKHAKGKPTKVVEHKLKPINVKAVRGKTGMSQLKGIVKNKNKRPVSIDEMNVVISATGE